MVVNNDLVLGEDGEIEMLVSCCAMDPPGEDGGCAGCGGTSSRSLLRAAFVGGNKRGI